MEKITKYRNKKADHGQPFHRTIICLLFIWHEISDYYILLFCNTLEVIHCPLNLLCSRMSLTNATYQG